MMAEKQSPELDVFKRFASTGYVRNLIVFHGARNGQAEPAGATTAVMAAAVPQPDSS